MAGNKKQSGGENSVNIQLENFVVDGSVVKLEDIAGLLTKLTQDELAGKGPIRFYSNDIRDVIEAIDDNVDITESSNTSAVDFTAIDLAQKNQLNELGQDYFDVMRQHHEPYFHRIDRFLHSSKNNKLLNKYYQFADEMRCQIAANRSKFDSFELLLVYLYYSGTESSALLREKRRVYNVFLSFMYFNCDIGRKHAPSD